ncbi:hypothetical protein LSH36_573g04012 [Paralvinella palmiformis]|uniref:Enoyl-[acyl-carrier-protein] reductase, mitochondrial n=1 Tax=Paralvinella palmiformis TaxID=53620 RepID=A0AAD9MX60_9ANNE|nr:hypothetical protein LSH36_573g04012 [Paralvinella palmiformis]
MFHICRNISASLPVRVLTGGVRCYCTPVKTFEIIYDEHGDPEKVLKAKTRTLPSLKDNANAVIIKMMAAPVNPADINMIQGVYPIKPGLPAIGGNEGVGEVIQVGDNVKILRKGDWVVPKSSGWGTWRTHVYSLANEVMTIPNDIPPVCAATLGVNPCTAYRMLKDFAHLRKGDVIIQNGANSGVGQAVIQIAKELGFVTINIVRNRPEIDKLTQILKALGANYVFTDEFLRNAEMKIVMKSITKPKLALNCVGGRSAAELLKYLQKGGIMVTYGGMSKHPLMVPAGPLIFADVTLRGFWMTQWNIDHNEAERRQMWDTLCSMVRHKMLQPPACQLVDIENFSKAVSQSVQPYVSHKQILVMDKSLKS